jgi:hypothetical protein
LASFATLRPSDDGLIVDCAIDDPRHDGKGDKVKLIEEGGQRWHYVRTEGSFEVCRFVALILEIVERQYQILVNTSDREKDSEEVQTKFDPEQVSLTCLSFHGHDIHTDRLDEDVQHDGCEDDTARLDHQVSNLDR